MTRYKTSLRTPSLHGLSMQSSKASMDYTNKSCNDVILLMLITLLTFLISFHPAQAQEQPQDAIEYIYEDPTLEKLSQMYWRLNKFKLDDKVAVDNFMRINECQIYKDFFHNEFEWRDIRRVGQENIKNNIEQFPLRFEFAQPFSLAEYDFDRKGFAVINDHAIDDTRIFEVSSRDIYQDVCGEDRRINGYPRVLRLELSRPLTFDFVPMEELKAESLILDKSRAFKQLSEKFQTKNRLYAFRDAIMVMKVKLFAYKGPEMSSQHGYNIANVLGVLEGIEVYSDPNKDNLLYEEAFRRKQPTSDFEKRIREKFKQRKEKKRLEAEEKAKAETAN